MNTVEPSRRDFLRVLAGTGTALALRGPLGSMAAETEAAAGSPRSNRWKKCARRSSAWGRGAPATSRQ